MAFDGITVAAVVQELEHTLVGGRISKIAQPENDELLLTIKGNEGQKRLYISASASLPLIYLTNENKPSPMTAPGFCMLLRKHLVGARITGISQPDFERGSPQSPSRHSSVSSTWILSIWMRWVTCAGKN